jgi:hypothetical protein
MNRIAPRKASQKSQTLSEMEALVREGVDRTPGPIADVTKSIPAGFPDEIADAILKGAQRAAESLGDEISRASAECPTGKQTEFSTALSHVRFTPSTAAMVSAKVPF